MTRTRSLVLSLLFLSCTLSAHAQWQQMNGLNGNGVNGLATIDTNVFAGNKFGVFQWVGDSAWNSDGLSGTGIQSLFSSGSNLFAETEGGLSGTGNFGQNWATWLDTLYVFSFAISGSNYIAGTDNGVYISTDNGNDWKVTNDSVDQIYALASVGSNVIAGSIGILISSDNGATWNPTNNILTDSQIDVYALTVNGNDILAGTGGSGIFISSDNGTHWSPSNNGLTDYDVNAIIAAGSKLFVGTQDSGIFLSLDNGATWLAVNDSFPFYSQTLSFATDSKYLYAGTYSGGVWRRPLAEMNAADGVTPTPVTAHSIQAYPNPFTQSTTIDFTSPSGDARITIVNILGAEVAQIYSGELDAGNHSFSWNANGILPGMYECIVQMNGHTQQLPIILTK